MIAGTIARLEDTVEDPLESFYNESHNRLPAFYVKATQTGLGEHRPIQQGVAADTVEVRDRVPTVVVEDGGLKTLLVEDEPRGTQVVTEWVADVTGTGLVAAESVTGDDQFAFPFDLFLAQTGEEAHPLHIDVPAAFRAWADEGALSDVWMAGSSRDDGDDGGSTSIQYHDAANGENEPTFGLGFVREWNGGIARGVMYETGYVAVFNVNAASKYVHFVQDCLLPFAYVPEDPEAEFRDQAGESEAFADEVADYLKEEGIEHDRDVEHGDLTEFDQDDVEAEAEAILEDLEDVDDELSEDDEEDDYERDEDGQIICGAEGCTNTKAVAITDQGPLCYICLDGRREEGEDVEVLEADVNEGLGGESP